MDTSNPQIAADAARAIRAGARLTLYRNNFELFAQRELQIQTEVLETGEKVMQLLRLRDFQRKLHYRLKEQEKRRGWIRQCWLKSRKIGTSTLTQAEMFHRTALHRNVSSIVVAHDAGTAETIFQMAKRFYDFMSDDIKPMVRYSTKQQLVFENPSDRDRPTNPGLLSRIIITTARNIHSGAGQTFHNVQLSEAARYLNAEDIETSTLQAMHLAPGTMGVMESTARVEGEWFKEQCENARKRQSPYEFYFIGYNEDPMAWAALDKGEKLRYTSDERMLMKHFKLKAEQIKWRRLVIGGMRGDESQFRQEFPLCLAAGTRVSTNLGIIDVQHAASAKTTESGRVERWCEQPPSKVYKLRTQMGRDLRATFDHPVATVDGFIWLGNLKPSDAIILRPPMFADGGAVEPDLARLLGYFGGDGSFYHHNKSDAHNNVFSVACDARDLDVVTDVTNLVERYLGAPRTRVIRGNCIEVRSTSREHYHTLSSWCALAPDESKLYEVPETIFRSCRESVLQYLRGLFESDGSASGNKVRWGTKSERFAQQVQLLLLGFGINAPIEHTLEHKQFDFYTIRLSATQSRKFHDEIGFVGARKRSLRSPESHVGRPPAMVGPIDFVESVVEDGFEPTYDFTIEGAHVFSANGILTHNTYEEAWIIPGALIWPEAQLNTLYEGVTSPKYRAEVYPGSKIMREVDGRLAVWQEPIEGVLYDMGVDPAKGEEDGDFSVAEIIRRDTREQVAEWRGHIGPGEFADVLAPLGYFYNTAQINVELTGGFGYYTNNRLSHELGYPNLYIWRLRDRLAPVMSVHTGWETHQKSKTYIVGLGKDCVYRWCQQETRKHPLIRSEVLWQEMKTFVRKGEYAMEAAAGANDDCVIAWLLALVVSDDESYGQRGEDGDIIEAPEMRFGSEARVPVGYTHRDPALYEDDDEVAERMGASGRRIAGDIAGWRAPRHRRLHA